jgi:hypothetical protein
MLRCSEKCFYAKRTLVVLSYSRFWQRHSIDPDVRYAVTLPESALTRYSKHINYIRGGGGAKFEIGLATEMMPLSGHGLSFFSGFRNLIFFFFPPDFKKKWRERTHWTPYRWLHNMHAGRIVILNALICILLMEIIG